LTFAETSPSDKAHSVVENLNRIGPDSMPISVQKAGRKIRHVLRDIEPEDEVAVSPESNTATQLLSAEPAQRELLDAAKNLDERIYPLFLELDLANDTIATLNVEIQELRRQLKVAAFQEAEMKQLRRSFTEGKTEYKTAVALLAKTKEAVLRERSDNSRLSHTVQRQLSELSLKEGDNDLLRAKLIRRDNRVRLLHYSLFVFSHL
jgi:chromosome segregation ATPase